LPGPVDPLVDEVLELDVEEVLLVLVDVLLVLVDVLLVLVLVDVLLALVEDEELDAVPPTPPVPPPAPPTPGSPAPGTVLQATTPPRSRATPAIRARRGSRAMVEPPLRKRRAVAPRRFSRAFSRRRPVRWIPREADLDHASPSVRIRPPDGHFRSTRWPGG
jgi:hypothetical protein